MLKYAVCAVEKLRPHLGPLIEAHAAEAAAYSEPVDIDWTYFTAAEQAGRFSALFAFDGKRIAGYAGVFCFPAPFFRGVKFGVVDVVFLRPEYRKGMNGVILLRKAEALARRMGATHVSFTLPVRGQRAARLLIDRGYSPREIILVKQVRHGQHAKNTERPDDAAANGGGKQRVLRHPELGEVSAGG